MNGVRGRIAVSVIDWLNDWLIGVSAVNKILMKKILVLVAFVLVIEILPTSLWASDLTEFLGSLEGKWSGEGVLSKLDDQGRMQKASLTTEFQVTASSSDTRWLASVWMTSNQESVQNTLAFVVRDENVLFIDQYGVLTPANVLESTPWSLIYQLRQADIFGRILDVTFKTEINGHTLWEHNTAELNGVIVYDEEFKAEK